MDLICDGPSLDKLFHCSIEWFGENPGLGERSLDSALSFTSKSWFVLWNTLLWTSISSFYFTIFLKHLADLKCLTLTWKQPWQCVREESRGRGSTHTRSWHVQEAPYSLTGDSEPHTFNQGRLIFQTWDQQHTQRGDCEMRFDLTGWAQQGTSCGQQNWETPGQRYAEKHHIRSATPPKPMLCSQVLRDHQDHLISRNSSGVRMAEKPGNVPGYLFLNLSCVAPIAFLTS